MATVRQARLADADALGHVHVRAWQEAYRGIMPDDFLDALDPAQRATMWRDRLRDPEVGVEVLVAIEGGALVGFAVIGPLRGGSAGSVGELQAINLAPATWRRGIGSRLLAASQDRLAELGYDRGLLWVAENNERARRFYEQHGWTPTDERRSEEILGITLDQIAYTRALEDDRSRT